MSSSDPRPPPPPWDYFPPIVPQDPYLAPKPNPATQPPTRKLTQWGTPYPIWKIGDLVMVPVDQPCEWRAAIVVERRTMRGIRGKTDEEFKKIVAADLSQFEAFYDVVVEPDVLLREVPERYIVPRDLEVRLWLNKPYFKIGEDVVILIPEGARMKPYMGHINYISDDHIVRHAESWFIYPRLYAIYIPGMGTTGYWSRDSIQKIHGQTTGGSQPAQTSESRQPSTSKDPRKSPVPTNAA